MENLKNKPDQTSRNHHDVHNPHDKHVFNALKEKAVAKDMFVSYLPNAIINNALFDKMHPYQSKKVSPQHREFQADILYLIPLKTGNKALAFVHIEHQSQPTKDVPLRIWQYLLLILQEYHQNHPNEPLPLVYPCILYTGEQFYRYSTNLFDLFEDNNEQMQTWMTGPIQLIDVCRLSDETIKKHELFGVTEFAFKHRFRMALKEILENLFPWIKKGLKSKQLTSAYTTDVLKYLLEVVPDSNPSEFEEAVRNYFAGQMGEDIMTAAQQLRQQGMQQGMQQEQHHIAKNLLAMNALKFEDIAKATGLSAEALRKIKIELESTTH